MKKTIFKLFLATFPIISIITIYIYKDPFKVLYKYDNYFISNEVAHISLNKDFVSTEIFLKNYIKYNYDSYIFGSSRAMFYPVAEWSKFTKGGSYFHFDTYGETLYGTEKKINFLHNKGVKIKNALLIWDYFLLKPTINSKGHIYCKHPAITGESNLDFQFEVFRDFLDFEFLYAYIKFLIFHKADKEMIAKGIFSNTKECYNNSINEFMFLTLEEQINSNPDSFYKSKANIFYLRDKIQKFAPSVIGKEQKEMLLHIKSILSADNTSYKIIINPLYDQMKLDSTDFRVLKEIFGNNCIYDFSGINKYTDDIHNYYETSHYRVSLATEILNIIYK